MGQRYPELATQLVDARDAGLSIGSNRKVEWRCPDHPEHTWLATVTSRVNGGGCPYCTHRRLLVGFNDIATLRPDMARMLANPDDATTCMPTSRKVLEWRCLDHPRHVWRSTARQRAKAKDPTTCPICAGKLLVPGINDLITLRPDIARLLADKSLGATLGPKSHKVVTWVCPTCGNEFDASVADMSTGHAACPECAQRRAHPGRTDLATTHPAIARQLVDETLAQVLTAGSNKPVEWECPTCHGRWTAPANGRTSGHDCPYCAGRRVLVGFNDLATLRPDLAAQLVDPSLASTVTTGSKVPLEWRCDKDPTHTWTAYVYNRHYGGTGCPICASAPTSAKERAITDVLRTLLPDDVVRANVRDVLPSGLELDAYMPSRRLAVEFHGTYWHSTAAAGSRRRHLDKLRECEEIGIRLVQVWEDVWDTRHDAVCSMLAHITHATDRLPLVLDAADELATDRTYARKLMVTEIDSHVAASFLARHHVQGPVTSTRRFALTQKDGTVRALLCLRSPKSGARMSRGAGDWEIVRYATRGMVPGGFSRLLAHAERTLVAEGLRLDRWVTFAALDVSQGGMYERCGFVLDGTLPPDYSYVGARTEWRRVPKERYQKRCFRDDDSLEFEEGWTEAEAAGRNGLFRTWDSGKLRYVKNVGHQISC